MIDPWKDFAQEEIFFRDADVFELTIKKMS